MQEGEERFLGKRLNWVFFAETAGWLSTKYPEFEMNNKMLLQTEKSKTMFIYTCN